MVSYTGALVQNVGVSERFLGTGEVSGDLEKGDGLVLGDKLEIIIILYCQKLSAQLLIISGLDIC